MADKPYIGRKAGTFVKDKETGKLHPRGDQPAARTAPARPASPAKPEKGK